MGSSAASSLKSSLGSGFDVSKASSTSVKGEESGGGSEGKMLVPKARSSGSDEGGE